MIKKSKVHQIAVFDKSAALDENLGLANSLMLGLDPNDVISSRCLGVESNAVEVVFLQETSEVADWIREHSLECGDQIFGEQE